MSPLFCKALLICAFGLDVHVEASIEWLLESRYDLIERGALHEIIRILPRVVSNLHGQALQE